MAAGVTQVEHQLRELTPASGAYFNEVRFGSIAGANLLTVV